MSACLECVYKHLGQALIIHEEEVPLGYPEDVKRVIGHLGEAARHAVRKSKELAECLREHRRQLMDVRHDPTTYLLPYEKLMDYVDILIACEKQKSPFPELPDELKKPVPKDG